MLLLTFEEFLFAFDVKNKAMSKIDIERISHDITLIPIEIVMRDELPETLNKISFKIIVYLHPTDGTHWLVLVFSIPTFLMNEHNKSF